MGDEPDASLRFCEETRKMSICLSEFLVTWQ